MDCNKIPYDNSEVKTVNVTLDNTKITGGSIECKRRGNVVMVYFRGVTFSGSLSGFKLGSGFPKPILQCSIVFSNSAISRDSGAWLADNNDGLYVNISNPSIAHWAGITYVTSE